ncbi:MAG TPA: CHASE3 domain-containing protein [Stellaceae bacterium]|nr:CHASE3 domain-containing protein [Stellaceae bacterium]
MTNGRISLRGLLPALALIVVPSAVLVAIQYFQAVNTLPDLGRSQALVVHTLEVINVARALEKSTQEVVSAQRGYIVAGSDDYLAEYRSALDKPQELLARLKALTTDNADQQRRLEQVVIPLDTLVATTKRAVAVRAEQGFDAAQQIVATNVAETSLRSIDTIVEDIIDAENKLLLEREAAAATAGANIARMSELTGGLAAAIMIIGCIFLVTISLRAARTREKWLESEEVFRVLVDGAQDIAIYMLDPEGRVSTWNRGAVRIKGYEAAEIVGQSFSRFFTQEDRDRGVPQRNLEAAKRTGKSESEGWRVRRDGSRFWASAVIETLRDDGGTLIGFVKVTRDMTARRTMEEQLRHSQKMDAIGQLTGGIAHDFNNLLAVIIGNIETLQRREHFADPLIVRRLDLAMRAAERGAAVTRRLLAFSHRQSLLPKSINLNRLVAGMSEILERTLGEDVIIETYPDPQLWQAYADENQLESAILNLAINARDAMPQGGTLTIETANATLDDAYVETHPDLPVGEYVVLAVRDTGIGMSEETAANAFVPFFTTKEAGHGTGLGLSQVYGFAKQSGGTIRIRSKLGQGTTMTLYFPRMVGPDATAEETGSAVVPLGKPHEKILIVEDEEYVRHHGADILSELGYQVLVASDGRMALAMLDKDRDIGLLFTDIGLPGGMNGRQLADEARHRRPGLKVLYMTGYAGREGLAQAANSRLGMELIIKPFSYAALATKVREAFNT